MIVYNAEIGKEAELFWIGGAPTISAGDSAVNVMTEATHLGLQMYIVVISIAHQITFSKRLSPINSHQLLTSVAVKIFVYNTKISRIFATVQQPQSISNNFGHLLCQNLICPYPNP